MHSDQPSPERRVLHLLVSLSGSKSGSKSDGPLSFDFDRAPDTDLNTFYSQHDPIIK